MHFLSDLFQERNSLNYYVIGNPVPEYSRTYIIMDLEVSENTSSIFPAIHTQGNLLYKWNHEAQVSLSPYMQLYALCKMPARRWLWETISQTFLTELIFFFWISVFSIFTRKSSIFAIRIYENQSPKWSNYF